MNFYSKGIYEEDGEYYCRDRNNEEFGELRKTLPILVELDVEARV